MSASTIVLLVLAFIVFDIAAIAIYAATRPDSFSVERTMRMDAPAETIFGLMNSPRLANQWNPFVKADPNIAIEYLGPESGAGAICKWSGNAHVGAGTVEIVESRPFSDIVLALRMVKPMKADNRVEYALRPDGNGTLVTWRMSGRQPFIGKLFSIVMNVEKMVGPQFEKGLADLRALAERQKAIA
jgi:hypothetical protein